MYNTLASIILLLTADRRFASCFVRVEFLRDLCDIVDCGDGVGLRGEGAGARLTNAFLYVLYIDFEFTPRSMY